ncbi:V-type immunoglobulin domain-containing suppressor of T-cell activation [Pseudophryne corroboree]|uniref:V-type immunoglobulin domain-containing suppressor of T-cell activation n=1 Tax=Pseudophryne corroboree TaxID=495146 RepID=UPI0030821D59
MDVSRRSQHPTCSFWECWIVVCLSLALHQDQITAYTVSALHSKYICPAGQDVNLTCSITGHPKDQHHQLTIHWTIIKERNPDCSEKKHVQNMANSSHHKAPKSAPLHSKVFHRTLTNISHEDGGGYCCILFEKDKHHAHVAHSYIELQVKTGDTNLQVCSFDENNDGTTAAALAILACIIGILCLPLILVLVYKQRKAITNRRAQELVRMDSDVQGLENPVFDDPPAGNLEQRPRLIFMASRQQSDTGRHLLSEPNTPLSPPGPTDVFFPSLEPVPDSPDPMFNEDYNKTGNLQL